MRRGGLLGFGRARSGSAAVEFAFIAPVLILLGAGVFELTRALQARSAIDKLASQYAITYADCVDSPAGACNTELATFDAAASLKNLEPLLVLPITLQLIQVLMDSNGKPQVTYPSGGSLSTAQSAAATNVLTSGQTGVVVTVSYTYTLDVFPGVLNGIVPSSMPMTYTVAQLKD